LIGSAVTALGLAAITSDFVAEGLAALGGGEGCGGVPMSPPDPDDAISPPGTLQTSADGTVTTPGGYKIQSTGQFAWQVTGPDGQTTKVSGDPHVAESEGGKWDFQSDSTFVLGDGTRINVSTQPWGNAGARVTSNLEIINGNDRVNVSGIDQGTGVVGPVTQDGYQHVNDFGGANVFVEGPKSDQWSFQGKEILGGSTLSELQLGNELQPVNTVPDAYGGASDWMNQIFSELSRWSEQCLGRPDGGDDPYQQQNDAAPLEGYGRACSRLGEMLETVGDWVELSVDANRRPFNVL
jgi:hypothetical protein